MVIVNFIRDKDVGLFARAKRLGKGCVRDEAVSKVEHVNDSGYNSANLSGEEESDKSE